VDYLDHDNSSHRSFCHMVGGIITKVDYPCENTKPERSFSTKANQSEQENLNQERS
jgi:hypothetical protein